jgi:hypothetical protein
LAHDAAKAQVQLERIQNLKNQAWGPNQSDILINDRGLLWDATNPDSPIRTETLGPYPVEGLKQVMPHLFQKPFESEAEQDLAFELATVKRLHALVRYERQFANRRDRALRALTEYVA